MPIPVESSALTLVLVRHGEASHSTTPGGLGLPDPVLSATGRAQAHALREQLPAQVGAVLCSPARRARQTAEILAQAHGLLPQSLEAFGERRLGAWAGLSPQQVQARYLALAAQRVTEQWLQAPPGGEPIAEVARRVSQGLQLLRQRHAGGVVVLVTHGLVTQLVWALAGAGFDELLDWKLPHGHSTCIRLSRPLALPDQAPELRGNLAAALPPPSRPARKPRIFLGSV